MTVKVCAGDEGKPRGLENGSINSSHRGRVEDVV